jgi:hypothetical protein
MPRWESVEVSMVLVTALGWSRTLFPNGGVPNLKQSLVIKTLLGQASKTSLAVMSLHRCNMSYWDRACVCKPSVIKCHRTIGAANGKKGRPTDQVTQKKENLAYVAAWFWTWGILFCLYKILMALPFAHRTLYRQERKANYRLFCLNETGPAGRDETLNLRREPPQGDGQKPRPTSRQIFIGWMREIALSCRI